MSPWLTMNVLSQVIFGRYCPCDNNALVPNCHNANEVYHNYPCLPDVLLCWWLWCISVSWPVSVTMRAVSGSSIGYQVTPPSGHWCGRAGNLLAKEYATVLLSTITHLSRVHVDVSSVITGEKKRWIFVCKYGSRVLSGHTQNYFWH